MAKKKKKKVNIEHEPVARVKLDKMKRMIKSIERDYGGTPEIIDNMDITFEYIIASLFPDIIDNINKELMNQYIKGFNEGKEFKEPIKKIKEVDLHIEISKERIEGAIIQLEVAARASDTLEEDKEVINQLIKETKELQKRYEEVIND